MTGMKTLRLAAAGWAIALAADALAAPARRPAKKTATSAAAKVSASQLFLRLDSIDRRLDDLQKTAGSGPKAAPAPVQPAGDAAASKELAQALYNHGVYSRQAAGSRLAAKAIKLVTLVAGGALAVHGWTDSFDKSEPRTINNAYKHYPAFSYGVTTLLLGQLIGIGMDMSADGLDMRAARALMKPLESTPSPAAMPSSPAPSTLAPSSATP